LRHAAAADPVNRPRQKTAHLNVQIIKGAVVDHQISDELLRGYKKRQAVCRLLADLEGVTVLRFRRDRLRGREVVQHQSGVISGVIDDLPVDDLIPSCPNAVLAEANDARHVLRQLLVTCAVKLNGCSADDRLPLGNVLLRHVEKVVHFGVDILIDGNLAAAGILVKQHQRFPFGVAKCHKCPSFSKAPFRKGSCQRS